MGRLQGLPGRAKRLDPRHFHTTGRTAHCRNHTRLTMNKQNANPPSACGESTPSGRKVLMISVFLCDPQPIVQEGLKTILDGQENFELVGTAGSLEEAFSEIGLNPPNLAIVDRSFGIHNLLDWITRLRQASPETQLVVWAATISDLECFRVLQAGPRGILRKTTSHEVLFHCLQTVARKERWTEDLCLPLPTRPSTGRETDLSHRGSKKWLTWSPRE